MESINQNLEITYQKLRIIEEKKSMHKEFFGNLEENQNEF